jgi:3-phosphoshikimate 1-carboxyvinyltransferase
VPGDISSAVFWAAAAAGLPGSRIEIEDVGLNPSRTAVLDVLRDAGADLVAHVDTEDAGEPRGRLVVAHRGLRAVTIAPAQVPSLIDELPALAALATCGGELRVTGAWELRVKESDRIGALAAGLQALGGDVEKLPDGFHVRGGSRLAGGTADAAGDHRLAMAFAVAALGAAGPSVILGAEAVEVSYPGFFEVLESLTG